VAQGNSWIETVIFRFDGIAGGLTLLLNSGK
jgi:hypothetical protein